MYRKIGREIGNIAENKVNLHALLGCMSDIIFSPLFFPRRSSGEERKKKARGFNNGYQQKVLLKLRLMDGLSKKNNCTGWKVRLHAEEGVE